MSAPFSMILKLQHEHISAAYNGWWAIVHHEDNSRDDGTNIRRKRDDAEQPWMK